MSHFHVQVAALLWIIGGGLGIVIRGALLAKFQGDLRSNPLEVDGFGSAISHRSIESTIVHILLNLGIILVATAAQFQSPPPESTDPTIYGLLVTVFLVSIPFGLCLDGWREYSHQRNMLRRAVAYQASKRNMDQRETSVDQRETSVDQRETSVDQRETSVDQRETSVTRREHVADEQEQ